MTQLIEIENGIIRHVERRVVAEAPVTAMAEHLVAPIRTIYPRLPDHSRILAMDPVTKKGMVLVEMAPKTHHIAIKYDEADRYGDAEDMKRADKDGYATFKVSLPWMYFQYSFSMDVLAQVEKQAPANFALDHAYLWWAPEQVKGLDDKLWRARLPNINTDSSLICWGYTKANTVSLSERIDDMVLNFAGTIFNTHWGTSTPDWGGSLTQWEKASVDPLAWTKWEYWKSTHKTTPRTLIDGLSLSHNLSVADLTNSENHIPDPPQRFTVGKAMEWFKASNSSAQRRFLYALQQELKDYDPNAEEPAATPVILAAAAQPEAEPARPNTEGLQAAVEQARRALEEAQR